MIKSMDKRIYIFQGDSLLLPNETPDNQMDIGLPYETSKLFNNTDIFEIPSLNDSGSLITGASVPFDAILPANWKTIPVRQILSIYTISGSGRSLENMMRACHIARWRIDSRYCGTCGDKYNDVPMQAQRLCPSCGRMEFPRICPAVIVAITNDENKMLLAHNKTFKGRVYSHISGYNEAGETLEETVAREIKEEINISVKNIEYFMSQPWPFPNSLMVGFKAEYLSGEIKPDGAEIEDAKWFTKDNLPELPREGSLSRILINNWIQGKL